MGRSKHPVRLFFFYLEFLVLVPLVKLIELMPWGIARWLANRIGSLLYYIDKRDREIAHRNFQVMYPDQPLPEAEQIRIMKAGFRNVAHLAVETVKIGSVLKHPERFSRTEGYENIEEALKEKKGLIVITAHFGNWEILGGVPAKKGLKVGAIINRQFNPYTDRFLRLHREKKGLMESFYNSVSDLTRVTRALKKGGIVAMVADQTYYFKPIFVPFFGKTSATAEGPARLHLKFGAPLMMAFAIRQPDNTYVLKYEKAVKFEPSGDMDADCARVMTWVNEQYEKIIRQYPEQWFSLFHDRWEKTKVEDFADMHDSPYDE